MPTRLLRDGILSSERIARLGWEEEVFYRRLMSVVDDYGRFSATPMLLRASCYPLHLDKVSDADIGKWLQATEKAGLVSVYPAADGKRYLQLQDFRQQVRAKTSKYPAPDAQPLSTCIADATHIQASVHLDGDGDGDVEEHEPIGSSASADADAPKKRSDPIPYQAIVDAYNGTLIGLAKVRELTSGRKTLIRSAWNGSLHRQSLEFWRAYFAECQADDNLNGSGPYGPPYENWRPTFDHLLKAKIVTRVYEAAMDRMEAAA